MKKEYDSNTKHAIKIEGFKKNSPRIFILDSNKGHPESNSTGRTPVSSRSDVSRFANSCNVHAVAFYARVLCISLVCVFFLRTRACV